MSDAFVGVLLIVRKCTVQTAKSVQKYLVPCTKTCVNLSISQALLEGEMFQVQVVGKTEKHFM
jgi:hypothetical protein